jgi:hypothetical protein
MNKSSYLFPDDMLQFYYNQVIHNSKIKNLLTNDYTYYPGICLEGLRKRSGVLVEN